MTRISIEVSSLVGLVLMAGVRLAYAAPLEYSIDVSLDPVTHLIEGHQQIRWTNTAQAETSELYLHLYLNAFANSHTSFMSELGSGTLRRLWRRQATWGWTRVLELRDGSGEDLLPRLDFVRPDDGNMHDHTVARVSLPYPVLPGQSVDLMMRFQAQLPEVIARSGYAGSFHLVAQWFPKVGVLEDGPEPTWSCHQYHATSEFYADFATYTVTITVPEGWVLGATGVESGRRAEGRSQVVTYRAERVHDFAWVAAPADEMSVIEADFDPHTDVPLPWVERAQDLLGLSAAELELAPVHLRLILPRSQSYLGERMLRALRLRIAFYGLRLGPYPYPQLTVVAPPLAAREAGGMEYPTFMTTGASWLAGLPLIGRMANIESVAVHELGHQYFQGLVASNEPVAAWLDEGVTGYFDAECIQAIIDHGLAPEMRQSSPWAFERAVMALQSFPLRVDQPSWTRRSRHDDLAASYVKTALALKTLEGLLGPGVMARALRSYVEDFRYAHPRGEDLQAAVSAAADQDLDWFFAQAIRGDATPDWSVLAVRHLERSPPRGLRWEDDGWTESPEPARRDAPRYRVEIEVGRRGDFVGPVEVLLRWSDGRTERRHWDGTERWVRWTVDTEHRLTEVIVDPDGLWALETARRDNYWRDEANRGRACGVMWRAALSLRALAGLSLPWS